MWKSILKTATLRQSAITTTSTIINGLLGAVFYIFIARILGPSDFGLLTIAVTTMTLVGDIADLGTNTGLVRFVSASLNSHKDNALRFLKLSLEIKSIVWLFVLIIGLLLAPTIAEIIFRKPELTTPLRLSFIGVGGALLFSFTTSSLQAFQKFTHWGFINITTNLLRLILVFILAFYSRLNLPSSIITFISLPFLGFFLGLLILPTRSILSVKKEGKLLGQFFRYNRFVALFTIFAAISSRLDTFISARLLTSSEVGIYGAAQQLTSVIPQIVTALGVVAAPKFSKFTSLKDMITYFKKLQIMVLGISSLGLLAIPLAYIFIPLLYGKEYLSAIPPFVILLMAMLVFLISVPVHNSIFYYFAKPKLFVWVGIGHLLIISLLGYLLILSYGIIGAAISVLIGMLFNFLVPLGWFLVSVRKKDLL